MNDQDFKIVTFMKDLGVIFSANLKFADHLTYVINKAKKKLGVVIRSTYDFKGPNTILTLFKSLVAPILIPMLLKFGLPLCNKIIMI